MLADALMACHKNSIAAGGRKFALKQFIAGRNRLENEGAQALAKAFEVNRFETNLFDKEKNKTFDRRSSVRWK